MDQSTNCNRLSGRWNLGLSDKYLFLFDLQQCIHTRPTEGAATEVVPTKGLKRIPVEAAPSFCDSNYSFSHLHKICFLWVLWPGQI